MNKEFLFLQKQNKNIRNKMREMMSDFNKDELWILINELITNEIEQERYCNE